MLENNGIMPLHFSKGIIFSPEFYTESNYKQVLRYNIDSLRHDSEDFFSHILSKELISGYTPVKWWQNQDSKRGSCRRQDPENSDSNWGEE